MGAGLGRKAEPQEVERDHPKALAERDPDPAPIPGSRGKPVEQDHRLAGLAFVPEENRVFAVAKGVAFLSPSLRREKRWGVLIHGTFQEVTLTVHSHRQRLCWHALQRARQHGETNIRFGATEKEAAAAARYEALHVPALFQQWAPRAGRRRERQAAYPPGRT